MDKKLFYSGLIFFLFMAFWPFRLAWSMQVTDSLRLDGFGMQGYYLR